jgi:hypothetical protein
LIDASYGKVETSMNYERITISWLMNDVC